MSTKGPQATSAPVTNSPQPTGSGVTIGKKVSIKGQLSSEEDLYLDGQIEGSINLPQSRLTVGESGNIQASIEARAVDVHGNVEGNVEARERIIIRSAANLVGDLKAATITIEDGAYCKGSIDIVRPATAKSDPAPSKKPAATASARRRRRATGTGSDDA